MTGRYRDSALGSVASVADRNETAGGSFLGPPNIIVDNYNSLSRLKEDNKNNDGAELFDEHGNFKFKLLSLQKCNNVTKMVFFVKTANF